MSDIPNELPTNPYNLLNQWAASLFRQGLSPKRISETLSMDIERVKQAIREDKGEIAAASARALKESLPELLRGGAMRLLAEAMRPEKVEKACLRDLVIAAGIMFDKAEVMEHGSGANNVSIFLQIQNRIDKDELAVLSGKPLEVSPPKAEEEPETVEPIPVEPVEQVQTCPRSEAKKGARPDIIKSPAYKSVRKRVSKRVS